MVYALFNVFLDIGCKYFAEDFCIIFIKDIGLRFSFLFSPYQLFIPG
jgi:hypothetical protein